LGEILLDRSNFTVMTRYISSADNLKLMMNLLRDRSRNIQFEAFHVFKVFVANPHKTRPIVDILVKNQDKLIHFLGNFHNDRQGKLSIFTCLSVSVNTNLLDDEQFNDEKAFLIKQIQELQPIQD
jgi:calcium binding protein 39